MLTIEFWEEIKNGKLVRPVCQDCDNSFFHLKLFALNASRITGSFVKVQERVQSIALPLSIGPQITHTPLPT